MVICTTYAGTQTSSLKPVYNLCAHLWSVGGALDEAGMCLLPIISQLLGEVHYGTCMSVLTSVRVMNSNKFQRQSDKGRA
jgi:hypothetical protein